MKMLKRVLGVTRRFSNTPLDITIVDTSSAINGKFTAEQCRQVVEGFYKHGVIAIRDPRVDEKKNQEFLGIMAKYFQQQSEVYYKGGQLEDARPESGYQVGITPELIERARRHDDTISKNFSQSRVRYS